MTGLDPDEDVVIEIASIVTNTDLEVLAEGPVIAIHQSDATLARMDEWNTRTHGESGLIDRVRASSFDEAAATELTLQFYKEWVEPNTSPMCGLDVTTLKLLAGYWRPDLPAHPKKNAHEALADIRESIEELRYYRGQLIQG